MKRRLTDRARELRKCSTLAERKLWHWLRRRYLGGFKFRRQHSIDGYILDFYCPALNLCVEVDGTCHDSPERMSYDESRTRHLSARGITVIRLGNEHIDEQPDGAWSLIVAAVESAERRHPELRPSP